MRQDVERIYHRGVAADCLNNSEALAAVTTLIKDGGPYQLVTLSLEGYVAARNDEEYREVMNRSRLVVPESVGLNFYSRLVGPPLGKISGGIYLAREIVGWCAENDKEVALIGSLEENRFLAQDSLRERFSYGGINAIPGEHNFNDNSEPAWLAQQLDDSRARFVIMAGDEGKAATWIDRWVIQPQLAVGVIGNFGVTIDREAGVRHVPDERIHRLGIGWLLLDLTRTPQRRERHLRGIGELARLGVGDVWDLVNQRLSVGRG